MLKKFTKTLLCCAALLTANANANLIEVDLELQLLADVSGSVDSSEYALQLQGYANAFRDASVVAAIEAGTIGSIAVQYLEWSSNSAQQVQVNWMLIDDAASATAFADALVATTRAFSGGTSPSYAIDFGAGLFFNNLYDAARQVMDVSGDGTGNSSRTANSRDAALALGVDTINGITIGNSGGLQAFYQNNVVGGTNAFHLHADTFADFTAGIKQKLVREITGGGGATVPEPASIALFSLAILGLASTGRKKAK